MNELTGFLPVFLTGASGVVVIEAAKFAAASMGRNAHQRTRIYKRRTYWLGLFVLILIAGAVTTISVGAGPVKLLAALQIGINAPAIVSAWATASQRNTIVKARGHSLDLAPGDRGPTRNSRSLSRRILEDQAW